MQNTLSKKLIISLAISVVCVPNVTLAQDILNLEDSILSLFGSAVTLFIGLAVVFFLWQLIMFMRFAESDKEREDAKGLMVYGVIAILVMVSIWGIIAVLDTILGLENTKTIDDFELIVPEQT